jgi:hypothetical protein
VSRRLSKGRIVDDPLGKGLLGSFANAVRADPLLDIALEKPDTAAGEGDEGKRILLSEPIAIDRAFRAREPIGDFGFR